MAMITSLLNILTAVLDYKKAQQCATNAFLKGITITAFNCIHEEKHFITHSVKIGLQLVKISNCWSYRG